MQPHNDIRKPLPEVDQARLRPGLRHRVKQTPDRLTAPEPTPEKAAA